MNLPNKITLGRIIISIIILIIMIFPFYNVGYTFPKFLVMGRIILDLKYVICGIMFIIASVSDFLDGHLARKNNIVTDFGKVMDAIADKILVNGVLIIMAVDGVIPVIIPVVVITRDTVVDCIKMISGAKGKVVPASVLGKIKTVCMMIGVSLLFFNNLPFELLNFSLGYYLVIVATILSVYSGFQYFMVNKGFITSKM